MAGTLYDYLHDKIKPVNWRLRIKIAEDIALVLYLHSLLFFFELTLVVSKYSNPCRECSFCTSGTLRWCTEI